MKTLDAWLEYQLRTHPRSIAMGLERVRDVAGRLALPRPAPCVITVGGTNGKGSTVAFLDAMLRAAGRRVGCYTSPHLLRYTERVRIDGEEADADDLVAAFARIETARGEIPLTYFEFGTLAALDVMARRGIEVAVLEVGLGGRLDAVNLVDADVAVVTTVDLDHQEWLGPDRDSIAREKAGIFRAARPAVIGDREAPTALRAAAAAIGARPLQAGREYDWAEDADGRWRWWMADGPSLVLPAPRLAAPVQRANAAAAIAALHAAGLVLPESAIARGVAEASVAGRLQCLGGRPTVWVDVAHNPQAAAQLAAFLRAHPVGGRTVAVFGALVDKDAAGIVAPLADLVDAWHVAGLAALSPRGDAAEALVARAWPQGAPPSLHTHADPAEALAAAKAAAHAEDRIVAFGSFLVAAQVLA